MVRIRRTQGATTMGPLSAKTNLNQMYEAQMKMYLNNLDCMLYY